AAKDDEHRTLKKISASGGSPQTIKTATAPSPTEPDWSPDGKLIAFTSQTRSFQICVVDSGGGTATTLVEGEDPCWSPNSRTLIYGGRSNGGSTLSLLDAPTKQYKNIPQISGTPSQPHPSGEK